MPTNRAVVPILLKENDSENEKESGLDRESDKDTEPDSNESKKVNALPTVVVKYRLIEVEKRSYLWRRFGTFLLSFGLFLGILYINTESVLGFTLENAIRQQLTQQQTDSGLSFEDLTGFDDWWDWTEEVFIPIVYETEWYNGEKRDHSELHTIGYSSILVGGIRLLQKRGEEHVGRYCYETAFDSIEPHCVSQETSSTIPFGNFSEGNRPSEFNYTQDALGHFGYQSLLPLGENGLDFAIERLEKLKAKRWLDIYTREVDIEFTLYNSNTKKWIGVQFAMSVDLAGGISVDESISVLRVDVYDFHYVGNIIRTILEIAWLASVLMDLVLEIAEMSHNRGSAYLMNHGMMAKVLDLMSLFVNISVIIIWIRYLNHPTRKEFMAVDGSGHSKNGKSVESFFLDILPLVVWRYQQSTCLTMATFLYTLRSLKYFRVSEKGDMLVRSLSAALPEILAFFPLYLTVQMGFTFMGMTIYGNTSPDWSSFGHAFFSVYEINFGLYDLNTLFAADESLLAHVYVYSVLTAMTIILINVFLAIVLGTWDTVHEENTSAKIAGFWNLPRIEMKPMLQLLYKRRGQIRLCQVFQSIESYEETSKPSTTGKVMITRKDFIDILTRADANITSLDPWLSECLAGFCWKDQSKTERRQSIFDLTKSQNLEEQILKIMNQ